MVFPKRVTVPPGRHEKASEKRMTVEPNAEHVINLALVPIGVRPKIHD
jgi:hypothetical protein